MEAPKPTREHTWLQRLAGSWTWEMAASEMSDRVHRGTESVRPLGDIWVVSESVSEGEPSHRSIMTIGFDPAKGAFVGTFMSSMMTFLWVYERGELRDGNTLDLFGYGPDFSDPTRQAFYRDTIQFSGPDERALISHTQAPDGTWSPIMVSRYWRSGN